MELLTHIFPAGNFTLLGVILVLPLLGAIINGFFGKRLGNEAVTLLALSAVGIAFIASLTQFFMLSSVQATAETAVRFKWTAWEWMKLVGTGPSAGDFRDITLEVAFSVDALSSVMCLVITGIGFLIHLYSTKYMETDPGYWRFFTYLNLFVFSMLVLVLGDSLPILFVGWEGVGLCSYLLIGFWFSDNANASAGKKAFITNRIGDFGLLIAMGLLAYYTGALDWAGIDAGKGNLVTAVKIWPVGDTVPIAAILPEGLAAQVNAPLYVNAATLVCLALFLGAMGKSAQFILHVWLPDAMAGPTPVSALIHAATMVTAGVYLLCRLSGVMVLSPTAMFIVACFGAFTAFFAATVALVQNDIKKVLAYSTVSQLGYMFLGVGVGAFTAGFFHVLTHAFFKACLFLGAGSVIHSMHARIHDTDQSQDMRNMGGMKKFMPGTFITFVAAWAAIAGIPLTSGFFSKDEILYQAKTSYVQGVSEITGDGGRVVIDNFVWEPWMGTLLYTMGFAAAIMTAFYMTRLVYGTFFGEFKGWKIVEGWKDPHADDHGHDDHHHHEEPGVENMEGPEPHESPWQITTPLWILGGLSLFGGFLSANAIHHFAHNDSLIPLQKYLEPVFSTAAASVHEVEHAHSFSVLGLVLAVFACFGGIGLAVWMYHLQGGKPAEALQKQFPRVHAFLSDKWRVDEFYEETVLGAIDSLADLCVLADKYIVDGILARLSAFLVSLAGLILRQFQTGRLQTYGAMTVVGLVAVGCYVVVPQDNVKTSFDHISGSYEIEATPGYGYEYRWDADGDEAGEWDTEEFGDKTRVKFNLEPNSTRVVRLQVKNAFGQVNEEKFEVVRPVLDASSLPVTYIDVNKGLAGARARDAKRAEKLPPGHPTGPKGGANRPPPNAQQLKKALKLGGEAQ